MDIQSVTEPVSLKLMEAARMHRFAGAAGRAALDCSVLEEDWQRGQSYAAHWHSITLSPQTHRLSVSEAERSERYWEARRLLLRFLSGAISRRLVLPHQPEAEHVTMVRGVQEGPADPQREASRMRPSPKNVVLGASEKKIMLKMTKQPRFLG